jgi:hypothetical protein
MDTQPSSDLLDPHGLLDHVIGDMAQAVSQRRDEPQSKRLARVQAAAQTIAAFQPRDAVEAMLAGHCVMFHELIVDSIQITLRGELDASRRATRSGIVAMDKAFGANLLRLEQYRTRQADSTAEAAEPAVPRAIVPRATVSRAETEIADRLHRHQSRAASAEAAPTPVAATADASAPPLCDDRPRDAHAATAAQMPGLNRQARRAIVRQARKRLDPGPSTIATANRHVHT